MPHRLSVGSAAVLRRWLRTSWSLVAVSLAALPSCADEQHEASTQTTDFTSAGSDRGPAAIGSTSPSAPISSEGAAEPSEVERTVQNAFVVAASPTVSESATVHNATQHLIAECMTERGFSYAPIPYPADAARVRVEAELPPTAEELDEHGYAWRVVRLQQIAANEPAGDTLSAEALIALDGSGNDPGCGEQAAADLGVLEFNQATQVIFSAEGEAWVGIATDPRHVELENRWSACMAESGYDVDRRQDAEALGFEIEGGVDGQASRNVAQADYACRDTSGLSELRRHLVDEAGRAWLDDNPGVLEAVNEAKGTMLERSLDAVDRRD
jgi:hypothetical protein